MSDLATEDSAIPQGMRLFDKDWQTYSKVVALNYMFHREVYAELRQFLLAEAPRSFSFLDLACGDARATASALKGTLSRHRSLPVCAGDRSDGRGSARLPRDIGASRLRRGLGEYG